jgi:Na+-translocating ferredoxin:NAD+ oxidoreductase RnfD subunit
MMRFIAHPATYAAWTLIVIVALIAGYYTDPYVFGIGALLLLWLTVAVAFVAIMVAIFSKGVSRGAKAGILISVAVAGVAIAIALAILRTFKWN